MATVQTAAVPSHTPPHPANDDVASGNASRSTKAPSSNAAEHVAPQLIRSGVDATVPEPEPDFETVSV
jgi:hypothetical protein